MLSLIHPFVLSHLSHLGTKGEYNKTVGVIGTEGFQTYMLRQKINLIILYVIYGKKH